MAAGRCLRKMRTAKPAIRFTSLVIITFFLRAGVSTAQSPVRGKAGNRVLYGQASYYADKFQGKRTASGELFDQKKLTAACNTLPLGTWIKVTNLRNGKWVYVKTNDRLHARMGRIIDLTRSAAVKLDYIAAGLTRVRVEVIGKKPPG